MSLHIHIVLIHVLFEFKHIVSVLNTLFRYYTKVLMECGANVNATDSGDNTSLILSSLHGHSLLVEELIDAGE